MLYLLYLLYLLYPRGPETRPAISDQRVQAKRIADEAHAAHRSVLRASLSS
jgi:hypothetical protein